MIIILTLAAFITATLSGIIGMGGGILLLATLFCFLPFQQAIPLHAAVQLFSNGSRIIAFRNNVDAQTVGRYGLGVLPGSLIGLLILWSLGDFATTQPYVKIIIGGYILVATFLPQSERSQRTAHKSHFTLLGFAAGVAALLVGSVGPMIAPSFARQHFIKERLIATKATCQMFTHLLKIAAFAVLGTIAVGQFSVLWLAMSSAVIPGTFLGKRLLQHVTPMAFITLYRVALSIAGIKVLIFDGCLKLFELL